LLFGSAAWRGELGNGELLGRADQGWEPSTWRLRDVLKEWWQGWE
jgi:hypothetical protein